MSDELKPCPNYACERGLVPIGPPDMATGEKPKAQCYRCRGTGQIRDRRQGAGRRDGDMPGSAATSPGDGRHPQEDNTAEETRLTIGEWQMHDIMVGRHALLQEAVELLDEFANIPQLELWHDRIVALREKINERQRRPRHIRRP